MFEKSKITIPVEKPERLTEEEAHKEADIIRIMVGVSPESSTIKIGHIETELKPKAEDYESALNALEKLRRIAEQESDLQKIQNKVKDLIDSKLDGLLLALSFLNTFHPISEYEMGVRSGELSQSETRSEDIQKRREFVKARADESEGSLKYTRFSDAENAIRFLEEKARLLEKGESENT